MRKDKVVVAIREHAGHRDTFLNGYLVVVAIDGQALDCVLLSHLEACVVVVKCQVHVLHGCRVVTLLRGPRLLVVLRHVLGH